MQYLLYTNALIRHFAQLPSLGKQAKKIIDAAEAGEHALFVSSVPGPIALATTGAGANTGNLSY